MPLIEPLLTKRIYVRLIKQNITIKAKRFETQNTASNKTSHSTLENVT